MYDTILLPIDGSAPANRATEHAIALAEQYDATLHVMYVVDTARYGEPALSSTELVIDELEDRGHDLLVDVVKRSDDLGIESHRRLCHGAPASEITGYADDIDADLIILGYQGLSHRLSDHMGSVAERVARTAGRPVLTT
ncbi:universal stress protein [Halegenticoccus tardaugens]|uniref:universal stress protein n=1 Tax=Halegenticoccus tardaugens TaxID=2071624 RepID=UPI00100B508D|nr:universal stress protein [Halegenticoccus tardaugens]